MRPIKFRVWAIEAEKWLNIYDFAHDKTGIHPFGISPQCVRIQQFTGLKDKTGKEVYEGDIVKFKYSVGNFAWEFMDDKETKRQAKLIGKTFITTVIWNDNAGFELNSGDIENIKSTHMSFPILYCKNGKIIGNIFENKL